MLIQCCSSCGKGGLEIIWHVSAVAPKIYCRFLETVQFHYNSLEAPTPPPFPNLSIFL